MSACSASKTLSAPEPMARPDTPKPAEGEPPKPKKKRGRPPKPKTPAEIFAPASITKEEAFIAYAAMDTPSINGLATVLRDQGHKVSVATLWRWSTKSKPSWPDRLLKMGKYDHLKLAELGDAGQALKLLADEGKTFDVVSAIKGLQSRAVRVMGDKLMEKDEKDPKKPGYFIEMTKLLSDLEDVKRKGYQSDVQAGSRPIEVEKPKEEKPEPPKPEVPKLVTVQMGPFIRPAGAKKA